jgi:hypothetical protein
VKVKIVESFLFSDAAFRQEMQKYFCTPFFHHIMFSNFFSLLFINPKVDIIVFRCTSHRYLYIGLFWLRMPCILLTYLQDAGYMVPGKPAPLRYIIKKRILDFYEKNIRKA